MFFGVSDIVLMQVGTPAETKRLIPPYTAPRTPLLSSQPLTIEGTPPFHTAPMTPPLSSPAVTSVGAPARTRSKRHCDDSSPCARALKRTSRVVFEIA
jgi:hypothetical protein